MTPEQKQKYAEVCMLLRVALTGSTMSPNIFEVATILGKDEVLARIDDCLAAPDLP